MRPPLLLLFHFSHFTTIGAAAPRFWTTTSGGPRTTLAQYAQRSAPPPRVAVSDVVWRPRGFVVGLGRQPPVPWVGFLRSLQESLSNPLLHREERPTRVTMGVWRRRKQNSQKLVLCGGYSPHCIGDSQGLKYDYMSHERIMSCIEAFKKFTLTLYCSCSSVCSSASIAGAEISFWSGCCYVKCAQNVICYTSK